MNTSMLIRRLMAAAVLGSVALPPVALAQGRTGAAPVAAPVAPAAPAALGSPSGDQKRTTRTTSIPAQGLFVGDQLSDSTKRKLTDLMMDAIGSQIELALLVPTGPWQIDGAGKGDTAMTEARLRALRRFLTDRGVDPNRIFVESRIDSKIKTPRLDVQLITSPANE